MKIKWISSCRFLRAFDRATFLLGCDPEIIERAPFPRSKGAPRRGYVYRWFLLRKRWRMISMIVGDFRGRKSLTPIIYDVYAYKQTRIARMEGTYLHSPRCLSMIALVKVFWHWKWEPQRHQRPSRRARQRVEKRREEGEVAKKYEITLTTISKFARVASFRATRLEDLYF